MTGYRSESIGWCCAAAVVIIFVAGLLVAVRDTIGNTNVALILVVFVVAAAVFGGRLAGITAAAVAAISFNFFHTQPYLTLRVKEGQDVVTVILLLVVGLVVGELALLRQRTRHEVVSQATGAHVLEDVLALLATDAPVEETWNAVRDGIQTALGVRQARFWPGAGRADLPLVTRAGKVVPTLSTWTGRGFQLPEVVSLPVVSGRGVLGHIEIDSTPGRSVSIDERRVAVALADILALALERSSEGIAPLL
jgi:K+-sensing histidine kinase KdpD